MTRQARAPRGPKVCEHTIDHDRHRHRCDRPYGHDRRPNGGSADRWCSTLCLTPAGWVTVRWIANDPGSMETAA